MPYTPLELANAFIKTGELHDALEALDAHLEAAPHDAEARRLRANVRLRLDQLAPARTDLEALPEQTADDHLKLSVIHERSHDPDGAIAAMQRARTLAPADERLTERLITLYIQQDRLDEALDLVRQQPRTWRWLQWEGDILAQRGADELATARYGLVLAQLEPLAAAMERGYHNSLKARVLLARAHAYRRLGQPDISAEHYEAAQALLPDDPTIAFNLGILGVMRGEVAGGIARCQQALDDAPPALRDAMRDSLAHASIPPALRDALSNLS